MRSFVFAVVCCLVMGVATAATRRRVNVNADPTEHKYQITVNDTQRTYYVYVPSSYTGDTPFPLMVFFHGMSDSCQSSTNFMIAGYTAEQVARKFLLAAPCGLNKAWSGPTDLPFAEALLKQVATDYSVDAKRVAASGFSNGAGLTEYVGCHIPNRWTAGVAIAAGWVMDDVYPSPKSNAQLLQDCDTLFAEAKTTMNVIKLQGSLDPAVVPYGSSGIPAMRDDFYGWALRNGCKGSPTTVYEDSFYKDESFRDCPSDASVRLVFLHGIPHQWVLNATFNYNTVILDQFHIRAPQQPLTPPPHAHHHRVLHH